MGFGGYYKFGNTFIKKGRITHPIPGSFKSIKRDLTGASASVDAEAYAGESTTVGRVAVGAIIAGPVGAIVGGMFKRSNASAYLTIVFPDGEAIVIDAPLSKRAQLDDFAAVINQIGGQQ